MPPLALVLMGPTGAGKSDFALRLADSLPIEIVSVDSMQVYRGMDIGTAKPSAAERVRVAHHLLDLRDPSDTYSAGDFVVDARAAVRDILQRGRVPLLVGGTMLYFRALLRGMAPLPRASAGVRAALDARGASEGWAALHAELAQVDPVAAARIHPNDPQRIQRALEVHAVSGRVISDHWAVGESLDTDAERMDFAPWGLVPGARAPLHERLAQRFNTMMRLGFLDEVRTLHARGDLAADTPAMRAVGYRQLREHVAGETTLATAIEKSVAATRQLAKRQLTWLRSWPALQTLDPFEAGSFEHFRAAVLQLLHERAVA